MRTQDLELVLMRSAGRRDDNPVAYHDGAAQSSSGKGCFPGEGVLSQFGGEFLAAGSVSVAVWSAETVPFCPGGTAKEEKHCSEEID